MSNVISFPKMDSFQPGKTTLLEMLGYLEEHTGSVVITLNIIDDNILVMSNTITFAHIKRDEINPSLYVIETGGKIEAFISETSLRKYVLTRVESNGIHAIFEYRV